MFLKLSTSLNTLTKYLEINVKFCLKTNVIPTFVKQS